MTTDVKKSSETIGTRTITCTSLVVGEILEELVSPVMGIRMGILTYISISMTQMNSLILTLFVGSKDLLLLLMKLRATPQRSNLGIMMMAL